MLTPMAFNHFKVLLVDDEPSNIDILRNALIGLECKFLVALSGEKALEMVEKNRPDLILLDVVMPGINGFEVCRLLRAKPETADIPVIFVTANQNNTSEGFDAGGSDYIPKPVKPIEVLSRVRHQLERLQMTRELKGYNERLEKTVSERTAELLTANRLLREEVSERRFMQDRLR